MRVQAYLRVVSDEATIRLLENEARIPGATVKAPGRSIEGTEESKWWTWQSAIVDLDLNDEDRKLKTLLTSCRSLSPSLRSHSGGETDVILEVVTRYKPNEGSPGLHLSAESVFLLSELGGSLDHDVVPDLS
jgi:hypothetical protein